MVFSKNRNFFNEVYNVSTADEQFNLYSDWAQRYDQDVISNGYVTPKRCAEALLSVVDDLNVNVLDVGCGTGVSGQAFRKAGFVNITGVDINPAMIQVATQKKIYKLVELGTIKNPLPPYASQFEVIAAVGVIGAGAAPLSLMEHIVDTLPAKGLMVISFNDHTLENPSYEERIEKYLLSGELTIRYKDYGDHMVSLNLGSMIYILQKS